MKNQLVIVVVLLATAGGVAGAEEVRAIGEGAVRNSDCPWPFVKTPRRSSTGAILFTCDAECIQDRDCQGGWLCVTQKPVPGLQKELQNQGVCTPPPGGLVGRVERAPGEPVSCTVELRGTPPRQSIARTFACNSSSGGFSAMNLPAGVYSLLITANTDGLPMTRVRRELQIPVNAGQTTYAGAIVLPVPLLVKAPGGPAPALSSPSVLTPRPSFIRLP